MTRHVLLLRGINVGGRRLAMADLRALLAGLGVQDVETYIQSGNAVFEASDADAARIGEELPAAIEAGHGYAPRVLVLSAQRLARLAADNPFADCSDDLKALHLYLLAGTPADDAEGRLTALAAPTERVQLGEGALYFYAPDGLARSKLAERMERALGTPATGRNWRTVTKLLQMAGQGT